MITARLSQVNQKSLC